MGARAPGQLRVGEEEAAGGAEEAGTGLDG